MWTKVIIIIVDEVERKLDEALQKKINYNWIVGLQN